MKGCPPGNQPPTQGSRPRKTVNISKKNGSNNMQDHQINKNAYKGNTKTKKNGKIYTLRQFNCLHEHVTQG